MTKKSQAVKAKSSHVSTEDAVGGANRPRNLLVTDATHPFTFSFKGHFGINHNITIQQTTDEDTWPGGALWDLGVLLARVVVGMSGGTSSTSTSMIDGKKRSKTHAIELPESVTKIDWKRAFPYDRTIVLELGCGVGLTGLVAAAAFSAKATFLTDLGVVVEKVTRPNVMLNCQDTSVSKSAMKKPNVLKNSKASIIAAPLTWGDSKEEQEFLSTCREFETAKAASSGMTSKKKKKSPKGGSNKSMFTVGSSREPGRPDLILIGDVAYQHKPGAPSHFAALVSTLMEVTGSHTYVLFGTRIRMPASVDLLEMMLVHLENVVEPLAAEEIDPSFAGLKHNMTVHILKKRVETG